MILSIQSNHKRLIQGNLLSPFFQLILADVRVPLIRSTKVRLSAPLKYYTPF